MAIKITRQGKYKVLKATQDLTDPKMITMLQNMVGMLISQGETNFLIDLSELENVNSGIIGVMSDIHKRVRNKNAELNVVMGGHGMSDVFNLSGLSATLQLHHSMEEFKTLTLDGSIEPPKKVLDSSTPIFELLSKGEFRIIRVHKEIKNHKVVEDIKKSVLKLVKDGIVNFVFDFRGIKTMTSLILGMVAGLNEKIKASSGVIHVIADTSDVKDVFNVTSLSNFLKVFSTKEEFLNDIKKKDETLTPVKILIADHLASDLKALEKKVREMGYQVMAAQNGQEAYDITIEEEPDLVLLEMNLPVLDGLSVCRKIKDQTGSHYLPVIFVTSAKDGGERLKILEAGGDDFISKPYLEEDLIARIRSHLKIRSLTQELIRINQDLEGRVASQSKELLEKERQLMQAEKMSMMSTFMSGAAHELKNPLFVISGWMQMLPRKGELNKEQLKCIEYVNDSTYRCIGIVENLLNLSRGNIAKSLNVELNEVVNTCKGKIQNLLSERGVILRVETAPYTKIMGNPGEIEQVVFHLVSNAIDAVTGRAGLVTLQTGIEGESVFLQISDNGAGMSDEVKQRMFDPFFSTKEVGQGAGLGMTIVKRIIDSHRGKITLDSVEGQGTTIRVTFPRTESGALD